jgi:CMP-2-keto-3-deoxyoctulosonic acid synthetase
MKKNNIVFIPVRLNSRRLKKKLNIEIEKLKIISHTIERLKLSNCFKKIILVTSDYKNFNILKDKFVDVIKSPKASSGIERVSKIIAKYKIKKVFILFGDEFLIMPNEILKFYKLSNSKFKNFSVINAVSKINDVDVNDKSKVKCIVKNDLIIDFRRNIIHPNKYQISNSVGLFCIRKNLLERISKLKSKNAKKFKIEQFIYIDNQIPVATIKLNHPYPSLNTNKDLCEARKIFKFNSKQRNILNKYI